MGDGAYAQVGCLVWCGSRPCADSNIACRQDMTVYAFRLVLELNRIFNGAEWVYKE